MISAILGLSILIFAFVAYRRFRMKEVQQRQLVKELDTEPYQSTTIVDYFLNGKQVVVNRRWKCFPYPSYYEIIVDGKVQYTDQDSTQVIRILGQDLTGKKLNG